MRLLPLGWVDKNSGPLPALAAREAACLTQLARTARAENASLQALALYQTAADRLAEAPEPQTLTALQEERISAYREAGTLFAGKQDWRTAATA